MLKLRTIFLVATATFAVSTQLTADPYLLDQRDPQYQKATEHISTAAQALAVAQAELAKAGAAYHLPGVNIPQMQDHLRPVQDTLQVLLSPEKKRMKYQTLTPDSIFFTPVTTGD